jgi:hypothetical protein
LHVLGVEFPPSLIFLDQIFLGHAVAKGQIVRGGKRQSMRRKGSTCRGLLCRGAALHLRREDAQVLTPCLHMARGRRIAGSLLRNEGGVRGRPLGVAESHIRPRLLTSRPIHLRGYRRVSGLRSPHNLRGLGRGHAASLRFGVDARATQR